MDLATHQRILLGLVRSSYQVGPGDDPYFHTVAASKDLEEARRNIFLWRVYVLERTCVLTVALLRQRNLLGQVLDRFIAQQNVSPFRETQGPAFLGSLCHHPDHLIASVAQFELALIKVRQGDAHSYTVGWAVEPGLVLHNLAKNLAIDEDGARGAYEITVSRELPSLFRICGSAEQ